MRKPKAGAMLLAIRVLHSDIVTEKLKQGQVGVNGLVYLYTAISQLDRESRFRNCI